MCAEVNLCVYIRKDTLPMGSVSINGYVWGEQLKLLYTVFSLIHLALSASYSIWEHKFIL